MWYPARAEGLVNSIISSILVWGLTPLHVLFYSSSRLRKLALRSWHTHTHTHTHIYHQVRLTAHCSLILSYNPSLSSIYSVRSFFGGILYLHRAGLCWLVNIGTSICRGPIENVAFDFLLTTPALLQISSSSYLKDLWYKRQVAIQQQFCGVLFSGFVRGNKQYSCIVHI